MSLDKDIEKVLAKELGPSAPSFLKRQCESHLKKPAENLTKTDLDELARWAFIGVKLILGEATGQRVEKGILNLK
jgi:hypothetical protein